MEFELDLGTERDELIQDLNRAIHAEEISEDYAVRILEFYELYKRLEQMGGDISPN